jgi:ATP-dependent helicase/DNAse subunit B
VAQLKYELLAQNPKIHLEHKEVVRENSHFQKPDQQIQKSEEIIHWIRKSLAKGLSASAINTYLDDPLEWYYSYVLRIREPKAKSIDAAVFGDIVHKTLEDAYKPFENKVIKENDFEEIANAANVHLDLVMSNLLGKDSFQSGANKLQHEIAKRTIQSFIKTDRDSLQKEGELLYLKGEEKFERSLEVQFGDEKIEVGFVGYADRVVRRNGRLSIVDYKTGNVESSHLKFESYSLDSFKGKGKALQLMLYKWLAQTSYQNEQIETRIISLPKPKIRDLVPQCDEGDVNDLKAFEAVLVSIIHDMLDPTLVLSHNPEFPYPKFE